MPPFLETLSLVGMVAMLWVGGGILVHGLASFGITAPEHVIHGLSAAVRDAIPSMPTCWPGWFWQAGAAIIGLIAGAITAAVVAVGGAPFRKAKTGAH